MAALQQHQAVHISLSLRLRSSDQLRRPILRSHARLHLLQPGQHFLSRAPLLICAAAAVASPADPHVSEEAAQQMPQAEVVRLESLTGASAALME